MTSKYFGVPFANSGDKTTIPDASQPSGYVSFTDGYTPDYEKDQATDPDAKDVPRQDENYFKFVVTEAIKEVQEYGSKPYDAVVDYPVGALILGSDFNLYKCLIKNGPGSTFLPVVDPVGDSTQTWEIAGDITPESFGAVGDGDGAGGGTDNSVALQNMFNYALLRGGEITSRKGVYYRCDTALTMLNTNSLSTLRYVLDLKGTIDFTNMGLSGTALSLGATSGNAAPLGSWDIRNINVWGPESVNPINEVAPETSTIGVNLSNALNVKIGRIQSQRFYKGYDSTFVFPLQADIGLFSQNWIGMYQGDATNNQTWIESQTNECHFSVVIQAAGVNKIVQQEYLAPRCEGSKVGFVIDPGSSGAAATMRSIKIDNPYLSSVEYDMIRCGRVPNFADASDRGVDSTSRIVGFQVMDGNWGVEGGAFSATRAAIVFPASELIARSFTGRLPIDDITNAIVGVITGGMIHFTGTDHSASSGVQWQNHYKIYDVNGDVVSYSDEDGSLSIPYFKAGNLGLNGQSTFGTNADGIINMAEATTPPSSAPVDSCQLWVADINGVDGQACYHMRTEAATTEALAGVVIKTSTGDIGSGREGMLLINTFDNNAKLYGDGAFRLLTSW